MSEGGNDLRMQLGVAIVGLSLLVSPLDWKYKIVASSIFGLSNTVVALREFKNYRRLKPQILEEIKELERTKRERDTLLGEVEARKKQVEADLYSKRTKVEIAEAELQAKQSEDKRRLEKDLEALEELKKRVEKQAHTTKLNAEVEGEEIASAIVAEAKRKLSDADSQLQNLLELEADFFQKAKEKEEGHKRLRSRTIHRIRKILILVRERHELQRLEIDSDRRKAEAQIKKQQEEWETSRQAEEEAREASFVQKLNDQIAYAQQKLQADNDAIISEQVQAQVQPYIQLADHQKKYIESLKDQLAAEKEKRKEMHLPKFPEHDDALSGFARRVIEFYYKRGVVLNFVNAYQTFTDVHVVVMYNPYHYPDGKGFDEGMITKHYDLLIPEFKLREEPEGGWGGDGYDIRLVPTNYAFLGMIPNAPNSKAVQQGFIKPLIKQKEEAEELTIPDLPELTDGVKKAIAEVEVNQMMEDMLGFLPSSRPFSKDDPITPLEVKTVDWYYRWRRSATNGAQPNITTLTELLNRVYGDNPRKNTRALTNRLKKIFEQLELEMITD